MDGFQEYVPTEDEESKRFREKLSEYWKEIFKPEPTPKRNE